MTTARLILPHINLLYKSRAPMTNLMSGGGRQTRRLTFFRIDFKKKSQKWNLDGVKFFDND